MKPSEHRRVSIAPALIFQRKTERLDWRRIASLDIDKLIQDGDPEQLEEYITPILFCKAESEFDQDRTDPGFIKVFRLSQLVGEYLLFCCEKDKEKLGTVESKCADLEIEKLKFVEEITSLRDNLAGAKKELKKRKDLLALTQTEALGSNNQDEFDQCPYCPKRFLTPIYLHAHMQRRHQGLPMPLHPSTTNSGPFQVFQQFQQPNQQLSQLPNHQKIVSTPTVYAFTMNTNGNVPETTANLLNNNFISSSDCNLNLQGRRESSTQTLITIESEGEIRNEDRNGNVSIRNSATTFPSTSTESKTAQPASQEVVTVIKSPGILVGPSHRVTHTNEQISRSFGTGEMGEEVRQDENASGFHVSKIDLNAICDLVEKYLEQKSVASQNQHYDKILSSIQQSRDQRDQFGSDNLLGAKRAGSPTPISNNSGLQEKSVSLMALGTSSQNDVVLGQDATAAISSATEILATRKTSTEMVEENVMRMKDEFEAQWRHLSEKVRDSGIEELKGSFLTEIKKVQEIILKSPGGIRASPKPGVNRRDPVILEEEGEVKNDSLLLGLDDKVIDKVEERLKRQEGMMEQMQNDLKSKMHEELQSLRSQLVSQETFWRSKLQATELEYKNQMEKLLQDSQAKSNPSIPERLHTIFPDPNPRPLTLPKDDPVERTSMGEIQSADVIKSDSPEDAFVRYLPHQHPLSPGMKSVIQSSLNPSNSTEDVNSNGKLVPIAKPRKIKCHTSKNSGQMDDDSLASSLTGDCHKSHNENTITSKYTSGSGFGKVSKDSTAVGGGGGGESRIINQAYQMPHEAGLIPSDSDEPEYLTIIHLEEPAPHINTRTTTIANTTSPLPITKTRPKALTGTQPQVHEYEEPLNVQRNSDQVSDYTFSASEDDSEDYSSESCNSRGDYIDATKGNHAERSLMKRSSLNSSTPRRNYVFDPKNGKLVEAHTNEGQKTQMDLVREKTAKEIDKQMEELGINPEASAIGMDEMARALKHLKASRRSLEEDPEKSQMGRDSLKRQVNYETAKRSIHQKLEKYGALDPKHTAASPLAKMFSKVKKSGSNWKTKVASAMKRKRKSPSNHSKKVISDQPDLKTSFFSKSRWGRKTPKKLDPNAKTHNTNQAKGPTPPESSENSSEDEKSSVDFEMPPFMTKSGPILTNSDRSKRKAAITKANKMQSKPSDDTQHDSDSEDIDYEDHVHADSKTDRQRNVHQRQVMKELKAKMSKHSQESPVRLKPNSPKPPGKNPEYKGPNFFVNGSPATKVPQVQVTSNGWSSRPITTATNPNMITAYTSNTSNSTPTNPSILTSENKNGKKPFRRDLLLEFQEAEDKAFQNNKLREIGGGRKNRNSEMPIVPEVEELYSSSETCCSSYEEESRRKNKNGDVVDVRPAYKTYNRDDDDDDDRKIVRERTQSFCRSDENRQGFRNRRSSCSLSESDDGRPEQENRKKPASRRRSLEDKGQYVSLKHPSRPKSPTSPRPLTTARGKTSISNNQVVVHGKARSSEQYSDSQSQIQSHSDPTLHSSDTSVWETDDDDNSRPQEDRKFQTKKSPRPSGKEITTRNRTASSLQQQSYSVNHPSSSVINRSSRNPPPQGPTSTKAVVYPQAQRSTSKSSHATKLGSHSRGPETSRRSPLNNSWDSD